ncbi:hypothetical protein Tco_1034766, partial [Tanacetum coccineum]
RSFTKQEEFSGSFKYEWKAKRGGSSVNKVQVRDTLDDCLLMSYCHKDLRALHIVDFVMFNTLGTSYSAVAHFGGVTTTNSNPRGFIYQHKDKKNRLMRVDELHKFSDDTLDDVRTALNDRLKGIRMQYLPQTIRRQRDKDNAGAMI